MQTTFLSRLTDLVACACLCARQEAAEGGGATTVSPFAEWAREDRVSAAAAVASPPVFAADWHGLVRAIRQLSAHPVPKTHQQLFIAADR
eukprot:COSAG06_NODE_2962_length_6022_cov_28.844816_1_plen_90_part_00